MLVLGQDPTHRRQDLFGTVFVVARYQDDVLTGSWPVGTFIDYEVRIVL